jgi:hypothetical protein
VNNYVLVDEMGTKDAATDLLTGGVLYAVKQALGLSVLNYQYGYVTELNETLNEYSKTPAFKALKFPLVWLAQPFTITHGDYNCFGKAKVDVFIFNRTDANLKAADRMTNNFKPVIYPIYEQLIEQISEHAAFMEQDNEAIKHETTDRYFWDGINPTITDVVDWMYIKGLEITIRNKC